MAIEVNVNIQQPIVLFEIIGDLDASTATDAQRLIMAALAPEHPYVAMDLKGVGFLSSAGLRVLLAVLREVRRLGGDLRVAHANPNVEDVIRTGFSNMVKTYGSVPGLMSSFYTDLGIQENTSSGKWTDSLLDQMRMIGDPVADEAVSALFAQGQVGAVNQLLQDLVANDYIPPSDLPPVIRDYLARTTELPPWADSRRIRNAQAVFGRYGMQVITALFCASLPVSYAARKGVHVLGISNRLNKNVYRRIFETAQMILDLMTPGGMSSDGMGLRSVQKVRLMHAAIRHLIMSSGRWDVAEYDHPINQEDLAGTLLTFSHTITEALPKLGVHLSQEEVEDFHHLWRVVGHVIGILPEMLPDDAADGAVLMAKIMQRQTAYSEDGCQLTANLLKMMEDYIPGSQYHQMPKALIRHLIGDEIADQLAVPRPNMEGTFRPFVWATRLMQQSDNRIPLFAKASEVFTIRLMRGITTMELNNKRTDFRIPDQLLEDWSVVEEAE